VLKSIHAFIKEPPVKEFKQAALAMRKDLWGSTSNGTLQGLDF
jgi:hypothetical protein